MYNFVCSKFRLLATFLQGTLCVCTRSTSWILLLINVAVYVRGAARAIVFSFCSSSPLCAPKKKFFRWGSVGGFYYPCINCSPIIVLLFPSKDMKEGCSTEHLKETANIQT